MTLTTHRPEPIQYLYRGHAITRVTYYERTNLWHATEYLWQVTECALNARHTAQVFYESSSLDDCMAAIDQVVDDA